LPGLPAGLPLATVIRLNKLRASTQTQYLTALRHFERAVTSSGQPFASTAAQLDNQLLWFAEKTFIERRGRARQTVACARLACIWLNTLLRDRLPLSRDVVDVRAWNRAAGRVQHKHAPITWPLTCWTSHQLMVKSYAGAAVAVLVAFDCLLRISEAAALRVCDVMETSRADARLAVSAGAGTGLVLRIRQPKTGDMDQSVSVLSHEVAGVLREWIATKRAAGATEQMPLFGLSKAQLHALFTTTSAGTGASVAFTWHSLRHGGATFMFMAGYSTVDVMARGRWRSERSAWHYQQSGRATAAAHGAPGNVLAAGERIASSLAAAFPAK